MKKDSKIVIISDWVGLKPGTVISAGEFEEKTGKHVYHELSPLGGFDVARAFGRANLHTFGYILRDRESLLKVFDDYQIFEKLERASAHKWRFCEKKGARFHHLAGETINGVWWKSINNEDSSIDTGTGWEAFAARMHLTDLIEFEQTGKVTPSKEWRSLCGSI